MPDDTNTDQNNDETQPPPPFTKFSDAFSDLTALLDNVKSEASKDKASGATAYGNACAGKRDYGKDASGNVILDGKGQPSQVTVTAKGAKDIIQAVTDPMTSDQVEYFSGLSFTDPSDDVKKRGDIVNSAYSAWDKSASKYMQNDSTTGDSEKATLQSRLQEFDAVIQNAGSPAVTPDQ